MIKKDNYKYDEVAREIFLPIFPVIAKEALSLYGREDGLCLDIGCGGGFFEIGRAHV